MNKQWEKLFLDFDYYVFTLVPRVPELRLLNLLGQPVTEQIKELAGAL